MARGSSRGQRDANVVASDMLLSSLVEPVSPSTLLDPLTDDPLLSFEDRRTFHPDPSSRPALLSYASDVIQSQVSNRLNKAVYSFPGVRAFDRAQARGRAVLAFRDPRRVAICVRRHIRREVLFAIDPRRKFGSGAGKRRRRNWASAIRC